MPRAAGPKGRIRRSPLPTSSEAEISLYSRRPKDLFAGISLEVSTLRSDGSANENPYGQKGKSKDIIRVGKVKSPACAQELVALLDRKLQEHSTGNRWTNLVCAGGRLGFCRHRC